MADNWRLQSACAGQPELFYPETGRSKNEAIKICNRCDVREKCLEWALDNAEIWGIWGGMTAKDRLKVSAFRNQLNGIVPKNPRSNLKKPKRSGFKLT